MSSPSSRLALGLTMLIFCSCSALQVPLSLGTPPSTSAVTPLSTPPHTAPATQVLLQQSPTVPGGEELFLEADAPAGLTPAPGASRSRVVKLNVSMLLDESGQARDLQPGAEIAVNLFPDVNYAGVIVEIQKQGDGCTWTGHLKDVPNSYMILVYTAGVFIGHFASPEGVYEVSRIEKNLYQIIQVDQSGLGGGEEPNY